MHTQLIKAHQDHDPTLLSSTELSALADQITWSKGRQTTLTAAMTSGLAVVQTDIVAAAADYVFKTPKERQAARDLWRRLSGDAHVLGWPMLQRAEYGHPDRRTGLSMAAMTGGLQTTANAYLGAFRVLKVGWALFDQRGEASG